MPYQALNYEFSEKVKERLTDYSEVVAPRGMTEKNDPFDRDLIYCGNPGSQKQASPLPNSKTSGYSSVYRNVSALDKIVSTWHPSITTYYDAFEASRKRYPNRNCLGQRVYEPDNQTWSSEYYFESYEEIANRRTQFASGVVSVVAKHTENELIPPKDSYVVSIYGPNSVNWVVADLACVCQGLPNVCLYDTLGPDTTEYILNFTESPITIASLGNVPKLLKIKHKLPYLKVIVTFESLNSSKEFEGEGQSKRELLRPWAEDNGVGLYSFDELVRIGQNTPHPHNPPTRSSIYAVNFTSGTTGNPKGVLISHANAVAGASFIKTSLTYEEDFADVSYSCLPLAHITERMNVCASLGSGSTLGYPHGPLTEIFDDLKVLKPTKTALVPRILNRLATSLKSVTIEAPGMAGILSRKAYAAKVERLRKTGDPTHPFWDMVWTSRIRKSLGMENINIIGTGSAPLSKDTHEFLKVVLGCEVPQGYGLTETLGGICLSQRLDPSTGNCGPVSVTCEVRLRDIPDMGYTSDDKPYPRGEVMMRGPQVFRGYYKEDKKTLDSFDEEGWFHSGDIGMIDDLGKIYIVDRVKNFFKLAQGEYIGPEKIENVYQSRSTLLNQFFIHGDSSQSYLVAVAGVNPETYIPFVAKFLGQNEASINLEETLQNKQVRQALLKHINNSVEPGVLQGFERVKNIHLALEPLSTENETLTQTLKIKRNVATHVFKTQIEAMYAEGKLDGAENNINKAKL